MTCFSRRQLADDVEYPRDLRNCAAHVVDITCLFLAAILALTNLAMLMVVPVLIYWMAPELAVGLAIVMAVRLSLSTFIVDGLGVAPVCMLAVSLAVIGVASQIVGHEIFERRKRWMADNPVHFVLGPPLMMAKLLVSLGLREDLAAVLTPDEAPASPSGSGQRRRVRLR